MPNSKMLCYASHMLVLILHRRGAGPPAGPALGTDVRQQCWPSQSSHLTLRSLPLLRRVSEFPLSPCLASNCFLRGSS